MVADLQGLPCVVCEHHRGPTAARSPQRAHDRLHPAGFHRRKGLVEHHHPRPPKNHAPNFQPPALPPRECFNPYASVFCKFYRGQGFLHPPPCLCPAEPMKFCQKRQLSSRREPPQRRFPLR